MSISHAQRVAEDGLDWTPDIDDLKPFTQELIRLVRQVIAHPLARCLVRLVNVDAAYGTTESSVRSTVILATAANCVVKDVDAMGSGPGSDQFWILSGSRTIDLHILQQLLDFRVIFGLDLVIVGKILLFAFVPVKLKSVTIKRVLALVARNIGDDCVDVNTRALNQGLWTTRSNCKQLLMGNMMPQGRGDRGFTQ